MNGVKMFKSLFRKKQPDFAQELALKEANLALRVRMDQLVRADAAQPFGQANDPAKNLRRIFEGQVAA